MRLLSRLITLVVGVGLFSLHADAHSKARGPLSYVSVIEDPTIQAPSHRVHAFSNFDIEFTLHRRQQRIRLTLEPNHDILADDAHVEYLDRDGNVRYSEPIDRLEHKVFRGQAKIQQDDGSWDTVGSARISLRRDGIDPLFEGAFSVMGNHHHILLRSSYMETRHELSPSAEETGEEYMIMFRDSDITAEYRTELKRSIGSERSCSHDSLPFNMNPQHPIYSPPILKRDVGSWGSMSISALLGKRQLDTPGIPGGGNSAGVNLRSTIGNTAGCPTTRKVALIGVATDCTYTGSFNSTDTVRTNIINQINSASDVYERTFNISLGLQNLTISDAECPGTPPAATPWNIPCNSNTTITDRLNDFSQWRGSRNDSNAYWTLLSTCNTGAEVGLAWLGQACVAQVSQGQDGSDAQVVTGANVVVRTPTEWQVIAHESGHTFGAVHDCDSQTCSDGNTVNAQQCCPLSTSTCDAGARYIMNPSTGDGITDFSPCSIGNICSAMGRNSVRTTCLSDNKGVTTISGNQCGNGIVEAGEDCDCGGEESCGDNACCDPKTCKFKNTAVCDDSNEDCCRGCQFASAGTVCRSSTGTCDPQETCSGTSATCPADVTAPDGQSCGNSSQSLHCASGQCTSRDLQCKTLMGSYTQNNDTYACNSQTCSLSCASPEFGSNVCYSMQQNFLDGTPCGGGGHCNNGHCDGSSIAKEVGSWINDNKPLVIGLSCALGGIILLIILGSIWRRCRRPRQQPQRRHRNRPRSGAPMPQPPPYAGGWNGPMPPQPPMARNDAGGPMTWNQQVGVWQNPEPGPNGWHQPPPLAYRPSVRYA